MPRPTRALKPVTLALVALVAGAIPSACRRTESASRDAGKTAASSIADAAVDASSAAFCAWALDAGNCWRSLVRSVDRCLGDERAKVARGVMSSDATTCAYRDGRSVTFGGPFTPGASMQKELDVTVSARGAQCLRFVRRASTRDFTATSTLGTVAVSEAEGVTTVSCPDGRRVRFTEDDALSCGLPEPEMERLLPGVRLADVADPRSTRLSLAEGEVVIFDCGQR